MTSTLLKRCPYKNNFLPFKTLVIGFFRPHTLHTKFEFLSCCLVNNSAALQNSNKNNLFWPLIKHIWTKFAITELTRDAYAILFRFLHDFIGSGWQTFDSKDVECNIIAILISGQKLFSNASRAQLIWHPVQSVIKENNFRPSPGGI